MATSTEIASYRGKPLRTTSHQLRFRRFGMSTLVQDMRPIATATFHGG